MRILVRVKVQERTKRGKRRFKKQKKHPLSCLLTDNKKKKKTTLNDTITYSKKKKLRLFLGVLRPQGGSNLTIRGERRGPGRDPIGT